MIAWVGGGLALLVLHALAVRAEDYDGLATAVRQSRVLGACLYGPASLVTAATGIVLVAAEDAFHFTDLWILIGFGGVLLSIPLQVIVADRVPTPGRQACGGTPQEPIAAALHFRSAKIRGPEDVSPRPWTNHLVIDFETVSIPVPSNIIVNFPWLVFNTLEIRSRSR